MSTGRSDNRCGHGDCRREPDTSGYNPTRRCLDHLREYRAICGVAPSEQWSPREDDGPTVAYDFGVAR